MSDPDDLRGSQPCGRGRSGLPPARGRGEARRGSGARAVDDEAGAREMLDEGEDAEVREMLGDGARGDRAPRAGDPPRDGRSATPTTTRTSSSRSARGAGGDEAGLWAGDVFRMLTKYAERRGFTVELLEASEGAYTFAIKGDGAYSIFKFEGGTHRVQRVPATESQGRIAHLDGDRRGAARGRGRRRRRSTRTTCRSTSTARPGPAASRSTRPTPRCASRTSRAGSSSRCRTRSPSCRTASARCACCARGCTTRRSPSSRPSSPPTAARRSAPASAPRRSARTTTASGA